MNGQGWARLLGRVVVGLQFFMAGWYKCFELTPTGHAEQFFTGPYADTWIPLWLLWFAGTVIPIVELVAGFLLIIGFRVKEALLAVAAILITVTYGHLLKEPLFSITAHIFPRTVLVMAVLLLPPREDRLSLDYWVGNSGPR